jgi:hypothetical protein
VTLVTRRLMQVLVALTLVLPGVDCGRSVPPAETWTAVPQHMGDWQGRGDYTIGITSHSGTFRIRWEARSVPDAANPPGRFRLTIHSAVSGRPLDEVINHVGPGAGTIDYEEDPRQFNLMVASADLDWTVAVDEMVLVRTPSPK